MLINVDDDKLRKIADTLRTLSSSRIKISHSDFARFIIGERPGRLIVVLRILHAS